MHSASLAALIPRPTFVISTSSNKSSFESLILITSPTVINIGKYGSTSYIRMNRGKWQLIETV